MAEAAANGHKATLRGIINHRFLAAVIILFAGVILFIYLAITSPHAAAKLSASLSERLGLPVTIAALRLHGDTLSLEGITVENPAGFADRSLLSIAAVRVAPSWPGLLQGRRALRLLKIDGAKISISRDNQGGWNFAPLTKKFSGGKGGAELFIDDLRVNDGRIRFNGRDFSGIALQLRNVASQGSAGADMVLAFADAAANRYRLTGNFRAGADPQAELFLEAPSLALGGMPGMDAESAVVSGSGSLQVKTVLQSGVVSAIVAATVKDGKLTVRNRGTVPLSGNLQGSARYDVKKDTLQLESLTLLLDRIAELHASGSIEGLKSGRRYDLTLGIDSIALAPLAALLPATQKSGIKTSGALSAEKIRITGSREKGITGITGTLALRDLQLASEDRLLFHGVGTVMKIATIGSSLRLSGLLQQQPGGNKALLENVRSSYRLALDSRFKPQSVIFPDFSGQLLGAPCSGSFSFIPAKKAPLSLSLQLPPHQLEEISYGGVKIASGAAALALELSGSSSANFSGTASLGVDNLQGSSKGERYTLGHAAVSAVLSAVDGKYQAKGKAAFRRAAFKSVAGEGSFRFGVSARELQLENGAISLAGTTISFSRLLANIPERPSARLSKRYPLDITLAGGAVSRGGLKMSGISASFLGSYAKEAGAKGLTGSGEIAGERLEWRGSELGAPEARLTITPAAAKITLGGTILGGTLAGGLLGNPNALAGGVDFDLALQEADLAKATQLSGKASPVGLSGGLTVAVKGVYERKSGVNCRIRGNGNRIAVANAKGKQLLNSGSVSFDASLAGEKITLGEAIVRLGDSAAVRLEGAVTGIVSPQRAGLVSYRLERTPLEKLIDPLVNGLPRFLQEAAVSGSIASQGNLTLGAGRASLHGSIELAGTGIDAGPNKLQVANINGSIPFSFGFPPPRTVSPGQTTVLKRPLYAEQLAQFSREATKGSRLTIGRAAFGPLEFSDTVLRLTAADGIIEALSFTSSLTSGRILGRGYVDFSQGASYGADLLTSNISLERICALFPGIKGYVSGRVDGIAMLEGHGGSLNGLNGYANVWTREGDGEKMLISKEFLQKLAGKNLKGFFFRNDRPFDRGEIMASLEAGYLTFDILDIENTNFFGVRDLKVSVTEAQNRIELAHLLDSISQAVSRGKGAAGKKSGREATAGPAPAAEFKWEE